MRKSYNATGINMDNKFKPMPDGDYLLRIAEVKDTNKEGLPWKTKNGDDYVQVTCEVEQPAEYLNRKVWYGVTFMDDKKRSGAGMALHFLKAIGEPYQEAFDIDTDNWIGKQFRARLKIAQDLQGKPKNEIQYIITDLPAGPLSDEVPF